MIKELINLANDLDKRGFRKEADYLDNLIKESTKLRNFFEGLGVDTHERAVAEAQDMSPEELSQIARRLSGQQKEETMRLLMEDPEFRSLGMKVALEHVQSGNLSPTDIEGGVDAVLSTLSDALGGIGQLENLSSSTPDLFESEEGNREVGRIGGQS